MENVAGFNAVAAQTDSPHADTRTQYTKAEWQLLSDGERREKLDAITDEYEKETGEKFGYMPDLGFYLRLHRGL